MPQINLLSPGSGVKKEETNRLTLGDPKSELQNVSSNVILYSSICLGILLFIWLGLSLNASKQKAKLAKFEEKVRLLEINPKEMENLKNEKADLEKKVALIDELSSRKFLFFKKLELIGNLIPEGVWLTEIDSKPVTPTVVNKGQRGKTTETKVVRGTMIIRGKAFASRIEDAVALIGNFIDNLKGNKEFSEDFVEIRLGNITKSSIGNRDIMIFDLECEIN